MRFLFNSLLALSSILIIHFSSYYMGEQYSEHSSQQLPLLKAQLDTTSQTIQVFQEGNSTPLLTQVAKKDFRPYLHPIVAPDGKGVFTEYSPSHHKHQTGIYWGFTRVNGRDFFHHPEGDYWQRVSFEVIQSSGEEVSWQTVYNLLDEKANTILIEIQTWTFSAKDKQYNLDLEWQGKAQTDVTIGKYDYGGLFVRMPWKEGVEGEVINAARQKNAAAEGQRAMWVDAGMAIEGRSDWAHVAIFDHPENKGYPQTWRVDSQLGIGTARSRNADWHIAKGTTELIKHRLVFYTGQRNDLQLTKQWENYTGNNSDYATAALWTIAQEEGRNAQFLTAEETVAGMTMKEGYQANVWASEPMMTQPMAFCWDDRGRLWVAENRDYESRGRGFSNDGNSRILILEDTDGDGKADSRKVFIEGIAFPAALAVGFDGLFLGAPPHLLYIPDKDKDDKADIDDIEVRLTGWGIRDRHETLNSFHWGPDGWLYGLQGFATPSKISKPTADAQKIYKHNDEFPEHLLQGDGVDINGGVWRYHPIKDRFEVVAHGFSNPWGIDYDSKGQLFITACVIPHLWHVIPNGVYHRQGGQHFNPYLYSDIRTIADHSHRSAHGGARIYQSDAFPKDQHGRIFMANIHEHAILSDNLIRKGSGYQGQHGEDFLLANNAQWVGFSMEIGPDGALYALDWHDAEICGQEVLNKETGRIFRVAPKQSLAENWEGRYKDLNLLSDQQLIALQTNPSDWHARRARLILQNRTVKKSLSKKSVQQLNTLLKTHSNSDYRLRALWTLHLTKSIREKELIALLDDQDEHIRSWAIQLLLEDGSTPSTPYAKFVQMAQKDPSPVVRLYLAAQLGRMQEQYRWEVIEQLVQHSEDIDDHNLPKMIWFGLEPIAAKNIEKALSLVPKSKIPLITNYIARRSVDAGKTAALLAVIKNDSPQIIDLLEGLRDGLENQTNASLPSQWATLYSSLTKKEDKVAALARTISQKVGDSKATQEALSNLRSANASVTVKQDAITLLAKQQSNDLAAMLPTLLSNKSLRTSAIKAVAQYDNASLGQALLTNYASFSATEKEEAIVSLASRPVYGRLLTKAIASKAIPKKEVPIYVARQLMRVVGSGFVEVWGPIEQQSTSLESDYAKYRKLLSATNLQKADIQKGQQVYEQTCGSCHKMYGKGGEIGPELTGSNRSHLDYLLFNILDPSGDIQDDYKMVVITARDGRTYTGNIVSESEQSIRLKTVGEGIITLAKSTIQSKEVTPVSMMPPGLLSNLTDEETINLIGYLQKMDK